jgi:hypothetical protein
MIQDIDAGAAADVAIICQYLPAGLQLVMLQTQLLLHSIQDCWTTWIKIKTPQTINRSFDTGISNNLAKCSEALLKVKGGVQGS